MKIKNNNIWGIVNGRKIKPQIYDNERIKQYLIRNNQIIREIKPHEEISLLPSEQIITLRQTSIGITNNKFKSHYHAITQEWICQTIQYRDLSRNIYIPIGKRVLNPRFIEDIRKLALKYNYTDIHKYYEKHLTRKDLIHILQEILKRIPTKNIDWHRIHFALMQLKTNRIVNLKNIKFKSRARIPKYMIPLKNNNKKKI